MWSATRPAPTPRPRRPSDGALGSMDGLRGSLDVDPGIGEHEPYVAPPATVSEPRALRSLEISALRAVSTSAGGSTGQIASTSALLVTTRCRLSVRYAKARRP